jgi:hypothetical protein
MKTISIDNKIIEYRPLAVIWKWFKIVGMCRNKRIYISSEISGEHLIRTVSHELVHKEQQLKLGWCKFLFLYFKFWLKYGYENIPFEREATELQSEYRGWLKVTELSYKKYEKID